MTADLWWWHDRAACHGMDRELFFGAEGEHGDEREQREERAKAVCRGCPVVEVCLESEVWRKLPAGIYGGMSADERKAERRRRLRRARAVA